MREPHGEDTGRRRERDGNGTRRGRNEPVVLAGSLRPAQLTFSSHSHPQRVTGARKLWPVPSSTGSTRAPSHVQLFHHFFLGWGFFLCVPVCLSALLSPDGPGAGQTPGAERGCRLCASQCACERVCAFAAPPRTRAGFPRSAFNLFPPGWLCCGSGLSQGVTVPFLILLSMFIRDPTFILILV